MVSTPSISGISRSIKITWVINDRARLLTVPGKAFHWQQKKPVAGFYIQSDLMQERIQVSFVVFGNRYCSS
jgi:hypothetical protein